MELRPVETYLADLHTRCLSDSLEFLFKSRIAESCSAPAQKIPFSILRAQNLFHMREYYQVASLLSCSSRYNTYHYCTCCPKEAVFLRNYSLYVLSSIKLEQIENVVVGEEEVEENRISEEIKNSLRMGGVKKTFLDSPVFDDAYLVFLVVVTKRAAISNKALKKGLGYTIQKLPYFWEPYKILTEIGTISNIDEFLANMRDEQMKMVFKMTLASKKCIALPELKAFSAEDHPGPVFRSDFFQGMRATVFAHHKESKRATEIFESILQTSFERDSVDQFANVLYSNRDVEKLSALLLVAYDRYYNLPIYHYVAGSLLSLQSNHVGSIEQFQKILSETRPGEFDIAYVFVAQEYFHLKDTCSAIKACNLAIKKNYNDYRVWDNMAEIYLSIDMREYALHFFRKCVELSPYEPGTYENFGLCFEHLNRVDEAVKCYRKGHEKGNTKCLSLLANVLYKIKNGEYENYMRKYIELALSPALTVSEKDAVSLEELEKYIEILEPRTEPGTAAQWRTQLKVMHHERNI